MSQVMECDAPECGQIYRPTPGQLWPWYQAVIQITTPQQPTDDDGEVGWVWSQEGERVDACTLEHLRIALVHKMAKLTDEPASS